MLSKQMNQAEEKSSVLVVNGRPQAVFVPSAPLETVRKPPTTVLVVNGQPQAVFVKSAPLRTIRKRPLANTVQNFNLKRMAKLIDQLVAVGNDKTGWARVLANASNGFFEVDVMDEMGTLNWLFPEISPRKHSVKRRQNVSQEYRNLVANLRRDRLGLDSFPTLEIKVVPSRNQANLNEQASARLSHVKDSLAEFMWDEISNQNHMIQAAANQLTAGGSYASLRSEAGTKASFTSSDRNAHPLGFAYESGAFSHHNKGAGLTSLFSMRAGVGSAYLADNSASLLGAYRAGLAQSRSAQGIGNTNGSFISLTAVPCGLEAGRNYGPLFISADFMKQPCVWLFKAVDPPPLGYSLAEASSVN